MQKGEEGQEIMGARSRSKPCNKSLNLILRGTGKLRHIHCSGKESYGKQGCRYTKGKSLSSVARFRNLPLPLTFYVISLANLAFKKSLCLAHGSSNDLTAHLLQVLEILFRLH